MPGYDVNAMLAPPKISLTAFSTATGNAEPPCSALQLSALQPFSTYCR
jgi:hypothetical protein